MAVYAEIRTTTDLSCAACGRAIRMLDACLQSRDGKHYHPEHAPKSSPPRHAPATIAEPVAAESADGDGGD